MKVTGIITEYNPFHLGHEFHLKNCKKDTNCDGVICIMSGNFVQRGLPAISDKWSRARMALDAGVDLVLELPTFFSISSAEYFAFASISILDSLNIVDNLYFGSEAGSIDLIIKVASILNNEPIEFKTYLKKHLDDGLPFPKARANSLKEYLCKNLELNINLDELDLFLNSSNNILGIEYCKTLLNINSTIKPYTLKRTGSDYNDKHIEKNKFASATAIRESIYNAKSVESIQKLLPSSSYNILKSNQHLPSFSAMFNFIKFSLINNPSLASKIEDASEGLDNKILKEIRTSNSLEELLLKCKSKRYTHTRISRILCQIFLGVNEDLYKLKKSRPKYARVLALNSTGAKMLKSIKKNSEIEIITKLPKHIDDEFLKFDIKATDLYSLINPSIKIGSDYLISPIIKKDF